MKKCKMKYLSVGLMLVSCLFVSNANCSQSGVGAIGNTNGELSIAKVQLTKPLALEYAISLFYDTSIDIAVIESQYKIGNRTINEFYSLPSHTSAYDIDVYSYNGEYMQHRRSMINSVLESSRKLDHSLKPPFDVQKSMEAKLDEKYAADVFIKGGYFGR